MSNPRIIYEMSNQRRKLPAPEDKPLIVHLVVNVEHWRFEEPMPRKITTAPHGAENVPDIPNFAWAEYGMRAGMPRILELFDSRGVPASTSINAGVIEAYPACAEAMLRAEWEFVGHGLHQKSIGGEADEGALIEEALGKITAFTGRKPRGWLSPGLRESFATPDILSRLGVEFVFDWVVDDLPAWMITEHRPLIAMPYNLELNDSIVYAVEKHRSDEMYRRFSNTLATFDQELAHNPKVLALGLHPHLIAVPHRIRYLAQMLDDLQARDDTIFMTGGQIADWYNSVEPAPEYV